MSEETTSRIAAVLTELHRELPSMRFGQLVLTVAHAAHGPTPDAAYEVEDDAFLEAAQRLLERRRREQATPVQPAGQVKRAVSP